MKWNGRLNFAPAEARNSGVAKSARSVVLMSPLLSVKARATASTAAAGGSSAMKRAQSFVATYCAVLGCA